MASLPRHLAIGLRSEILTIENHLQKGLVWLAHRYQTPYAEVDLLFVKTGVVHLVEVKSVTEFADFSSCIRQKQIQRLKRAAEFIATNSGCAVILQLALVNAGGAVTLLALDDDAEAWA